MKLFGSLCLLLAAQAGFVEPVLGDEAARSYTARGVIEAIAPDRQTVTIHHRAIPGYMMEMTMDFPVRKTNELTSFSRGDEVSFTLLVGNKDDWVESFHRLGHVALASAALPGPAPSELPELTPGDVLPDGELTAETGRTIQFSQFRGKAVAFTFFFTRCPLPDYCPRMNSNFAETRDLILSTPGAPANWELLSISFDPGFDKTETLTTYAVFYRGSNTAHWLFAAAPVSTLTNLAPRLDLKVMRQNGIISHNLRTVVLDPRGRIYRQFDGNQWTPQELADAIIAAARTAKAEPAGGTQISSSVSKFNP
jgi:protein SCO1/2